MKSFRQILTSLFLLCATVVVAHDFEADSIYYKITGNCTVAVSCKGDNYWSYSDEYNGCVVIPESVVCDGVTYSVTGIWEYAFSDCSGLTAVEIPNSVTTIGNRAFASCKSLASVVIPGSVTSIEEGAFVECSALASVEIPNSVTSIEKFTFAECSALTNIEIPNSITSIGNEAFYECSGLTAVVIPNSVTSIGYHAFNDCPAIASIESHITAGNLFAIHSSVFSSVDKAACTLYVPIGSKQAYATTDGWSDFLNVEEVDFTGIDEILSDDSQGICYDLNGRVVENPTKGLYIKNGAKVFIK